MTKFVSNFFLLNLIFASALWFVFWVLKKSVFQWSKGKKIQKMMSFYFPLFQHIVWTVFCGYLLWQFSNYNPQILVIFVFIFVFLGRSFGQNLFAGILFRLEKRDLRGTSLLVDEKEGVVLEYGMTKLCLKSDDGSRNYIPYEKLYRKSFVRTVKMEKTDKLQTLKVYLPEDVTFSQEFQERIRSKVLLNPYVAINEKVEISNGEEENRRWILLHYNLINPEHSDRVKETLRKEITEKV